MSSTPTEKPKRPSKLDPKIIRVGDRVQVNATQRVVRVGYPKSFEDYEADAIDVYNTLVPTLSTLGINAQRWINLTNKSVKKNGPRLTRHLIHELQFYLAAKDGFGGHVRSVHFKPATFATTPYVVRDIAMRQTGEYFPPSGGTDWESGIYESEPGGLNNQQAVRLLHVTSNLDQNFWFADAHKPDFAKGLWVLASDCVKLPPEGEP